MHAACRLCMLLMHVAAGAGRDSIVALLVDPEQVVEAVQSSLATFETSGGVTGRKYVPCCLHLTCCGNCSGGEHVVAAC